MRLVYISHAHAPIHVLGIRRWCLWAESQGVAPLAPYLVFLESWGPERRGDYFSYLARPYIKACDEVWLVGGELTSGMRTEIALARVVGVTVVDHLALGPEPPGYAG